MQKNSAPTLCRLSPENYPALFSFEQANQHWFEQWVPPRPLAYRHYQSFCTQCDALCEEMASGTAVYFLGYLNDELMGRFNLTEMTATSADVGYRIGERYVGKGLAPRFTQCLIDEARLLGLKTLTASALETNPASIKTLRRAGFKRQNQPPKTVELNQQKVTLLAFQRSL